MEKDKVSKLNSIAKKILKVLPKFLYDLLIIFCVLLTLIIVLQRITDSNQSFYGIRIFSVASGSMVPQFGIGEVVICQDVNPKDIEEGEVIVYRGNIGDLQNRLVMHEVIGIDTDENGYRTFHVKGIQNTAGDPDVKENQVLGKVIVKSLILSILYALATSTYASFIIIIILVINVFLAFRPNREPMQLNEHNEVHKDEEKVQEELEDKNEIEEADAKVEEEKKEPKKRKSTSKKKTVEASEEVKEEINKENIEEISEKKEPKKRKTTSKKKEEKVEESEKEVEEKDSNKETEISEDKPKTKNVTKKKKSSKNKEEIGDKGKSED